MKTQIATSIAGLSLAMALPVFAQSADAKYCADLKDKFEQYISDGNEKGSVATSLDVEIAKGKCRSDPASAIPVFEKALKNARITLPSRG
ncbi:MAG TPA: hypothetical protein VI232_22765 [Reyranella sp.]|nr:hypothetical protein [Rhodospirillaceae bacterium]MEA2851036.1 hypothetical protein [Rhodospirillaceae bacterium]